MTQNQKIAIGIGALALGYWLYTKNKASKSIVTTGTSTPPVIDDFSTLPKNPNEKNPCKGENEVPCANGSGKCYMINARYGSDPCKVETKTGLGGVVPPNAYRLKQDFSQRFPIGASGSGLARFQSGQVIRALKNPYLAQVHAVGKGALTTTVEGNQPDFNKDGQVFINIPESILEKL